MSAEKVHCKEQMPVQPAIALLHSVPSKWLTSCPHRQLLAWPVHCPVQRSRLNLTASHGNGESNTLLTS